VIFGVTAAAQLSSGGGGGGGGYVAPAVHFDGSTWLTNAGLIAENSSVYSYSFWGKDVGNAEIFFVETDGGPFNTAYFEATEFHVATGGEDDVGGYVARYGVPPAGWFHVMATVDGNHAAEQKITALYINDVLQEPTLVFDSDPAVIFPFSGTECGIGALADGGGLRLTGDLADLWVAPGVSLLSGATIPEATRRLFISADGKPVNPNGFPAGAVLLSGDATDFATNQGTGGAFALGEESNALTNASTSPSD
jgi:hypothetical protein